MQNTTDSIEEERWRKVRDFIKNKSPITAEMIAQIAYLRQYNINHRSTRLASKVKLLINLRRHPLQTLTDLRAPINIITEIISIKNINQIDDSALTPLQFALRQNNWRVAATLLDHGADVNIACIQGKTALYLACVHSNPSNYRSRKNVFTQLISRYTINLQDADGNTPLCIAALYKNQAYITTLLAHGADVNVQGTCNNTPLHYALLGIYGNLPTTKMISQLISTENINMLDEWNQSALQKAVHRGFHSTAVLLLKRGADPSTVIEFRKELTLSELCIVSIRRAMRVISDETLATLPLPQQILEQMDMSGIVNHFEHYLKTMTLPAVPENSLYYVHELYG